ncbi:hypothetical protein [Thermanaeromonas toyohensis]|uniref:hypothetical protein n=1 Tax=Thermanaeromonas toyohensis TaxID=161154 RepID=UPI0012F47D92|nr:hypothetical protein [Thermanaeromonas toyohensis]
MTRSAEVAQAHRTVPAAAGSGVLQEQPLRVRRVRKARRPEKSRETKKNGVWA